MAFVLFSPVNKTFLALVTYLRFTEVVSAVKCQGQSAPFWTFSATGAVVRGWCWLRADVRGSLASCTPSTHVRCCR